MLAFSALRAQYCPVSPPMDFWTDESTSSLGFVSGSVYSGAARITGTFTVDVTLFTFSGAEKSMFAGSQVVVNPGCTLRILSGSVLTAEQEVWDRIEVLPGGRLEVDNSSICGALIAVFSDAGFGATAGSVQILSSNLIRNQTGVLLQNYNAAAYPFVMQGSTIQGGPLFGASTANSSRGIVARRLETGAGMGITIGDAAGTANAFEDLDVGIEALSSSAEIYNNTFSGMQNINGLGEGYAVLADRINAGPYALTVGGIGSASNTMTDCRFGVSARRQKQVTVWGNTYSSTGGPANTGVQIRQTDSLILVRDNSITGFSNRGIYLKDNPGAGGSGCTAQIFQNSLSSGSLTGTATGIVVDEHAGEADINVNTIGLVFRGITVQSAALGTDITTQSNNIVFFYPDPSVSGVAYGIGYFGVDEGLIRSNRVRGNCPYSGGFGPCTLNTPEDRAIRGIQLAQTSDILVRSNRVFTAGGGLYIEGVNVRGNALCNIFTDCYTGLVFDALPTNGFGLVGSDPFYTEVNQTALVDAHANAENQWISSVSGFTPLRSISINGAQAITVRWWHRSTPATYDMPSFTIQSFGSSTLLSTSVGATSTCPADGTEFPPEDGIAFSSRMLEQFDSLLVAGSITSLPNEVFWQLQDLNSVAELPSSATALYAVTSLQEQQQARQAWSSGNFLEALERISDVSPLHLAEAHMLSALQTRYRAELAHASSIVEDYTTTWQTALTPEDREALWNLAHANPSVSGKAVFWAQSYLDTTIVANRWHDEEDLPNPRLTLPQEHLTLLFPNPAQDILYFREAISAAVIAAYDVMGRQVWSVQGPVELSSIDCSTWPNGMYSITWINLDGNRHQARVQVKNAQP